MTTQPHRAALITGSSRGIGKGIALALASVGYAVGINAPTADDEVAATVSELNALGAKAVAIPGDVADISSHAALLDRAEAALGPLTTLVNNAGVGVLSRGDLRKVMIGASRSIPAHRFFSRKPGRSAFYSVSGQPMSIIA